MIRFGGRTEDGRKLIGLALGRKNVEKLTSGQPIYVDGKTVGVPEVVIIIASAETSEEVMLELTRAAQETGCSISDLDEMLKHASVDRRPERSDG